jgi:nucleoside-diphosphate-sugar epimerase
VGRNSGFAGDNRLPGATVSELRAVGKERTVDARVLVTGAYGRVGRAVVQRLLTDKFQVVVTAHRNVDPPMPAEVDVRAVDLTETHQVNTLVDDVSPSAIVHLAAAIPPRCYADRSTARAVNVDVTAALVRAASEQPSPPRFVHASTGAVHGVRNPHRAGDPVTPESPLAPVDLYGCHKALAENIVRSSDLEWSILRLSSVIAMDPLANLRFSDAFYFRALVPEDTRVHTVDPRDVATAFARALTTDAVREVFMIAGDESHKRVWGEFVRTNAETMGLAAAMFPSRPGNPDEDGDWYPLGWLDTTRSQAVLSFQEHSCADTYAEIRARTGWRPRPLRIAAPLFALLMRRRAPYYHQPGRYADPWGAIRKKWGDPTPDALTV